MGEVRFGSLTAEASEAAAERFRTFGKFLGLTGNGLFLTLE